MNPFSVRSDTWVLTFSLFSGERFFYRFSHLLRMEPLSRLVDRFDSVLMLRSASEGVSRVAVGKGSLVLESLPRL